MANELNNQPARTGNMVASNGEVYNIVDLYIDVVRGNSYFQPFIRATMEYMTSTGTAEYVEFIGGYKSYGCKKIKLSLSQGTFNDLNQIDVYERI